MNSRFVLRFAQMGTLRREFSLRSMNCALDACIDSKAVMNCIFLKCMKDKTLCVFLENKSGGLDKFCRFLYNIKNRIKSGFSMDACAFYFCVCNTFHA